jgi:hypothetical protein
VAVLFLCEIDNITYEILLGEKVRSRAEASGMRVEIGDAEAVSLARTKAVHVALITVFVPAAVWMAGIEGIYLPFPAFWLAGAAEAVGDAVSGGDGVAGAFKGLAKVTGSVMLGFAGFLVLGFMAEG